MSYERRFGYSLLTARATTEADAEYVIDAIEDYVRQHGKSQRELAVLADADPASFTLFLQRRMPADWPNLAFKADELLCRLHARLKREAQMPVMTPMVMETLGMVRLLVEDGGIGLIQGDSGTGKTEAVRAVTLKNERSLMVQASTARAKPKPMLEDVGQRMGVSFYARDTAEVYRQVRERLPRYDLLIVDEVHKFIGTPDCLHVLADLLKETGVPQLWTATGDLRRYIDRRVGQWNDPFAQIRSRITHKIDLGEVRGALIRPEDVRELARRKFDLKLDAAAARELCELATLDNEGSLRLVENTLKHAKRLATAGRATTIDARMVRASMDRSLSKRTRERARQFAAEAAPATPAAMPAPGANRATA